MLEANLDRNSFKMPLGLWYDKLIPFIMSGYGKELYDVLKRRGAAGHKILPYHHRTFAAFQLTNPDTVKAVLVGMSPYYNIGKNGLPCADGLLFSNSISNEISPSLKMFYDSMDKSLGIKAERITDLSYLARQGVLLLNASLTTELGKATIHNEMGLWDNFNRFLYGGILDKYPGIPIVTIGKEAKKLEKLMFPMAHPMKNVEHPAYAYREHREWNCDNLFDWVNEKIFERNSGDFGKIYWDNRVYRAMEEIWNRTPWD